MLYSCVDNNKKLNFQYFIYKNLFKFVIQLYKKKISLCNYVFIDIRMSSL